MDVRTYQGASAERDHFMVVAKTDKPVEEQIYEEENIDARWGKSKEVVNKAAEKVLGKEEKKNKNEWYNDICKSELKKKVEARLRWIRTKKREHKKEYERRRRDCKKTVSMDSKTSRRN
ncbi:hypothetical protein ILUMI_12353 [Ignelater luminosus]|uniref:Uncharacterized protein n=1 Tax=Ignelater luminosus TaxID=2038154 RepID=A0A8K0CYL4_IGNLU|nr:hypothetical protein ILUMI_12353 [Ignelater luminosus]